MLKQTILWTALPHRSTGPVASGTKLRLSAFIAPRLWSTDAVTTLSLGDFPDFLDGTCYVVIQRDAYLQFINPTDVTSPAKRQAAIDHLPDSGRHLLFDDGRFQVWSPVGD